MIRIFLYIFLFVPVYLFGQITVQDLKQDSIQKYLIEEMKKMGVYDSLHNVKEIDNCLDKKIYFIGVHHIGAPIYYEKIKTRIDSFHNESFVLYYEGFYSTMYDDTTLGYLEKRMYSHKYRTVMGKSAEPSKLYSEVASKIEGLMIQPNPEELGALENDVHADVTIRMMVDYYESKYGRITSKTSSEPDLNERVTDIRINFRNEFIIQEIQNNKHAKIVILYGSGHFEGLVDKMNKLCQ